MLNPFGAEILFYGFSHCMHQSGRVTFMIKTRLGHPGPIRFNGPGFFCGSHPLIRFCLPYTPLAVHESMSAAKFMWSHTH